MRALCVRPGPAFSVADVHRGWVKGLAQAGCQVVDFNFDDRLSFYAGAHLERDGGYVKAFGDEDAAVMAAKGIEAAALEFWPDLVLFTSGFFVPPAIYQLLRARRIKTCLLHLESPYEDSRQMARAALVDFNVISDPTNLESFRAVNPNTWYIPHAYDPDHHHPGPATPGMVSDFCFVGTGYPSRVTFLEQVDWSGVDVALAGNWQGLTDDSPLRKFVAHDIAACCDNTEAVDLYRSTAMSANLYRREGEQSAGWAVGPREIELAAIGTFFLRESRGEGDLLFPMLPVFDGPAELEELLRYYLVHPDLASAAAGQARAAVSAMTFRNNAQQLLGLLNP